MADDNNPGYISRSVFVRAGRKGGSAGTGAVKARSSAQARAAAMLRWKNTPKRIKRERS